MKLITRRNRNLVVTLLVTVAIWWVIKIYSGALKSPHLLTGWLLVGLFLFLILYNFIKKLSIVPVGTNALWLQLHLYASLILMFFFMEHLQWSIPSGIFECILAIQFALITGSGAAGIYFSHKIPRRLAELDEQIILERIPQFLAKLRQDAETLMQKATDSTGSSTLADYYDTHLANFFYRPKNGYAHFRRSSRPLFKLLNGLSVQYRYMNNAEREYARRLEQLIKQKNMLDQHNALQKVLGGWLFVHIPLSYSASIFVPIHIILVYAFGAV
ncbi:MAG: hypothetical protein GY775_02215 [Candidatus Scalindua sp.]|nr:hypothetical protein [Candidatus Scalindua sp.]